MSATKHRKRSITSSGFNSTDALLTSEGSIANSQLSLPQRIAAWWINLCGSTSPSSLKSPSSSKSGVRQVHRYTIYSKSTPNLFLKQEWVERNMLASPSYQRVEDAFKNADRMLCSSNDELGGSVISGRPRAWSFASGEQFRKGREDRARLTEIDGENSTMFASCGTVNEDFVVVGSFLKETNGFGKRPSRISNPRALSYDGSGVFHGRNSVPRLFEALRAPSRGSSPDMPSPHFEPTMMNHPLMFTRSTHDLDEELQEAMGAYWRRPYPNSSILSIEFGDLENESSFGSLTGKEEWGADSAGLDNSELRQTVEDHDSGSDSSGMDSYLCMDSFLRNHSSSMGAPEEPLQNSISLPVDDGHDTRKYPESEERLEDSLHVVMDEYLEKNTSMVNSLVVQGLTVSSLEEAAGSGLSSKPSSLTSLMKSQEVSLKPANTGARPANQSLEPKMACPVNLQPCSLESSRFSNWSNTSFASSPEAEWWYRTSPNSSGHSTHDNWRDVPLPDSRLGPHLHLRGGAGKPDTLDILFGTRRPVGDVEAGKKLLDQPVGLLWYAVGGRNMGTTHRQAMKMTQERVEKGVELEREKEEKKDQKAREKEEKKKAEKANSKPGVVDKIKGLLKKKGKGGKETAPKDKGKALETNPEAGSPENKSEGEGRLEDNGVGPSGMNIDVIS